MSTTFESLKSRLISKVDILPPSLAGNIINDALGDIYKAYDWGFLAKKDYLRTPAIINTGIASVIKYSEFVTLNAAASTLIMAIAQEDVNLLERQFRNASVSANTGLAFSYNITDYDVSDPTAIILTIDPPYLDETNAAIAFQILKIYYNPPPIIVNNIPIVDFRTWKFVIDLKLHRRLHVDTTLTQLNNHDAVRRYVDSPRHVVSVPPNADGIPLFELYPAPKFERIYQVIYSRKGIKLEEEEDIIPFNLDEDFVLKAAQREAYEWLLANLHKYPELKGSIGRFQNLIALTMNRNDMRSYPMMLEDAIKQDEENYPKAFFGDYMRMPLMDSYIGNFPYLNEFDSGGNSSMFNTVLIDF